MILLRRIDYFVTLMSPKFSTKEVPAMPKRNSKHMSDPGIGNCQKPLKERGLSGSIPVPMSWVYESPTEVRRPGVFRVTSLTRIAGSNTTVSPLDRGPPSAFQRPGTKRA